MAEYKVSVLIPVYNGENYLKRAVNSIIGQTFDFSDVELIIVDDASTDNTKEIIQQYQEKYSNIRGIFLKENNGRPGRPRNIAMEHAESDYIIFLDCDDVYYENAIEILYNTIKRDNTDCVLAGSHVTLGNKKFPNNFTVNRIVEKPFSCQENFDIVNHNTTKAPWAKIYRRDLLIDNNLKFLEEDLHEDTYFTYTALKKADRVTLLPKEIVYNYIANDGSTVRTHDLKAFIDQLNGITKMVHLFDDTNINGKEVAIGGIYTLLLVFSNLRGKDKKIAIEKLYEFEKELDFDIELPKKELNLLNKAILNKNFRIAILISNIYSILYNNKFIQKIYKRMQ